MNPQVRSHLAVLLSFVIASMVVTWPLAIHLSDGIPYGGDGFQFMWNSWWLSKAVNDPSLSLYFTPFQFAPYGASLALHDLSLPNAYLESWLNVFFNDFASFNFLILFHYVLGAWGAYILAFYFTGNRPAGVIAGFVFGFSTHHAMHLSQLSIVSSGWMPLAIYYLIKYVRDDGNRNGILAVLMLLTAGLSSWYHYVLTAVVFFGFMLVGQVGLKNILTGTKRWKRALIPWIASAIILSPWLIMALIESGNQPVDWLVQMGRQYYLDPAWLVLPPLNHPFFGLLVKPLLSAIPGNTTEGINSIGLVAIILGILAWFRKKDPTTRAWCWVGLILFLLALGPTITIMGLKTGIPGPFRLWSLIPALNLVRVPSRFVGPFTLALSLSIAGYVNGLGVTPDVSRLKHVIFLWIIPVLILFETLVIPVPISGSELNHPALYRLPEIYRDATGDPNPPDLIINFPLLPERRQFLYQQTIHQIPMVNAVLSNPPPGARDIFLGFNWNPEFLRANGIDMVIYQPWAAQSSLGETFNLPESPNIPPEYRGREVTPYQFLKDVMRYKVAYEDERMSVFVP